MSRKILFIDRDGTLIKEPSDHQIDAVDKFSLVGDAIPSLLALQEAGYQFVMVSNQDGLGTKNYPKVKFEAMQRLLMQILGSQGIVFKEILICPHRASDRCYCRKPATGLVQKYLSDPLWDRNKSAVIGDRQTDMELAKNMGLLGLRVGSWKKILTRLLKNQRIAKIRRVTNETAVSVEVNLDGKDQIRAKTGIGFFDHMLEQIAKHGGFDLKVKVSGDLNVDEHHTVEDTGLALGAALKEALGDKIAIGRYGFFLPMDEASAQVAIDLSGRPYFMFKAKINREKVGGLATEMIAHFYRSLSESLGAALHIEIKGENTHHMIESSFKAVGRSLRMAIAKSSKGLPSTKGVL